MNKTYKIIFGTLIGLTLLLTYLEATEPAPVNWSSSYMPGDKIPLGSYVFFESWKNSNTSLIEEVNIPPYEFLNQQETPSGTYFFLNSSIDFDKDELNDLLAWVEKGNTAFISAYSYGKELLDTLNLETRHYLDKKDFTSRPGLNFVHPDLQKDSSYNFTTDITAVYFSKLDTLNNTILGTANFGKDSIEKVNFIKTGFGKGNIFLHTTPQAFSNYFLLQDKNWQYAEKVLAYVNKKNTLFWDNYYKDGKAFYTSPLYVLMNNRELKWAYYIFLLVALLFILFEGKRKQRAIPVVKPLKNQTYAYTATVGDMYLEEDYSRELGLKKIELFLEYIRAKYRIPTDSIDEEFYENLAATSGNSYKNTKELFERITKFKNMEKVSRQEFHELSQEINAFKRPANG